MHTTTGSGAAGRAAAATGAHGRRSIVGAVTEVRWAAAATTLFALGAVAHAAGSPPLLWWALYLACYLTGGWQPALAGVRSLREGTLDVDLLMIVAAIGAAAIGQVFDGALLIVIFATSGALEAVATRRTQDSVRALLDLTPPTATRRAAGGAEERIPTADLVTGDLVVVRPGERVGADGTVAAGESEVDEATLSGEPLPVLKVAGDPVYAGTVNGTGSLEVVVDRPASASLLAEIVRMVEQASTSKATRQLRIEKVEQRYSVGVVAATLALLVIPIALGAAAEPTLLRAMTFMIVASPCALVLATMPPLLSVIANAGRHGVLVKSATVLERIADVDVVAFDKTGTLTDGTPRVVDVVALAPTYLDTATILGLAAAAERPSEHPIAHAVVRAAHDAGIEVAPAAGFSSTPGTGVTATVDGRVVRVGAPGQQAHAAGTPAAATVARLETSGRTTAVVAVDDEPVGVLGLADHVRPGARRAVAATAALTTIPPVLLTGDSEGAAHAVAEQAGILQRHARLLPGDKVAHLQHLRREGHAVLVVGDGVNDAPAMATADVGVAMGGRGADLALETADVVLVRDDLASVAALLAIARRARRVVTANLVLAAGVIAVLVTWDLVGHLPLPLGVAGHEGSTVIVGLNGLRLLRSGAWPSPVDAP